MTSSMKDYSENYSRYYLDEIVFRRSLYQGTFVIVEGSSDLKFYSRIVMEEGIVIASNKAMAIEILENLNLENAQDAVAIVDKDFDELREILPQIPNLFFTDSHDLETLLIESPALDKVLHEFGSIEKIKGLDQHVRDILLKAGCAIGYLRWISLQDALHLKFTSIDYSNFLDRKSLAIDESSLLKEVKKKSQSPTLNIQDLQKQLNALKDSNHDRWQVCRGHDLVEILRFGLLKAFGSEKASDVKIEMLERSLRLAYYGTSYFSQTKLYSALKEWEKQNNYHLLKS